MKMVERLSRVVEEVLPFAFYWSRKRKQMKRAFASDLAAPNGKYERYYQLSDVELKKRLGQERVRAKEMDEKTFKMTLALTVGLTVLGSTTALLVDGVLFEPLRALVAVLAALAISYSLAGGFVALGALRTLPSYGYGTDFVIQAKGNRSVVVDALARQELINIVRHLRNESAYQCLRNGFLCLFAAVSVYAVSLAVGQLAQKQMGTTGMPPTVATVPAHSTGTAAPTVNSPRSQAPRATQPQGRLGGKQCEPTRIRRIG